MSPRKGKHDFVEEKLDRCCYTRVDSYFPSIQALQYDFFEISSLLSLTEVEFWWHKKEQFFFRFENSWLFEFDMQKFVETGWINFGFNDIMEKINSCANDVNSLGGKLRLKFRTHIDDCKQ